MHAEWQPPPDDIPGPSAPPELPPFEPQPEPAGPSELPSGPNEVPPPGPPEAARHGHRVAWLATQPSGAAA
jgi:hypothetical protein